MQGEVLSPILFSFYVNDCEIAFINSDAVPIDVKELSLFLLMYADDMVIFSESISGLQVMLDTLLTYTSKWALSVNIEKTKIVVFRNGGRIANNEKWFYNSKELEIVDSFTYLEVMLYYNGKYNFLIKKLSDQGRKAVFALRRNTNFAYLNFNTLLSLFDTYIGSILSYGSEVWGAYKAPAIERVHLHYCKNILHVKTSTNNVMVYYELGRTPLLLQRQIRMFKYWFKLLNTTNCIFKGCYDMLYGELARSPRNKSNWLYFIKNELCNIGLGDIWYNQHLCNEKIFCDSSLAKIKLRLYDNFKQNLDGLLRDSVKCSNYQYMIDNFCLQFYLIKGIPRTYKTCISKMRLSSHNSEY